MSSCFRPYNTPLTLENGEHEILMDYGHFSQNLGLK